MRIELLVEGINPVPWQAPEGTARRSKKGGIYVQYYKSASLEAYQQAIKECVKEAYPTVPMFASGVELHAVFTFRRQLDSGTTGEGKRRTAHRADRTNLLKSTEDALQGILYPNDTVIISGPVEIAEQGPDVKPSISVILDDSVGCWGFLDINQFKYNPAPMPPGNVWLNVYH